jgi:uncharacterized Zn finger protein
MTFDDLTWEDLKEWAGSRVVARGKSYRRAVEDLRVTTDGRLLAWVQGGDRYATVVSLGKSGKLSSVCTCPYAIACKHAVAVALAYLDAVQAGRSVPAVDPDDERLERLARGQYLEGPDEDDSEDLPPSVVSLKRLAKCSPSESPEVAARRYLESLSPSALLEFVQQLANDFPQVHQRIADRIELQSGDLKKLVTNTRREIERASAEPGWTRHWSNSSHIPNYSRVRERLESLLQSGHADEVVTLGEEILRRGIQQIEMSNDEGETGQEIATCMEIVFRALTSSSTTVAERLLWEVNARLLDDYCILDGIDGPWAAPSAFTSADWSAVADDLARRLEAIPVAAAKGDAVDSHQSYRRQSIMRWLLDALKHAGRERETTAILTREAEITECYVELVDYLLANKQKDAAKVWACKGFERTIEKSPGIAWALEERLRNLAAREKNLLLAAAFRAMEFFDRPDLDRYTALQQAASPLGLWELIRPTLLRWLETGTRPDENPVVETPRRDRHKASASRQVMSQTSWPLPSTGLGVTERKARYPFFPDTPALIAIAIQEKRNDDVLRWYKQKTKHGGWETDCQAETVAEAVQQTHPDEALAIWKRRARSQIATTKPSAYEMAGAYLKKMKAVYRRTDRLAEWEQFLADLRRETARKPRMIEVLDGLEGKRSRILNK